MATALRAGYTPLSPSPASFTGRMIFRYVQGQRAGYTVPPGAAPKVLLDVGGLAVDPKNPAFMVPLI